ncbi:Rieske [2Fe-2S] iron-sulfur domain-containing protein [Tribonema minus]|uniref:Rieske [2Fe-2S] iron-sulfur domain-containing protein n=1 Tax=Tribonema minus TaxID=303371 RepID=A0A836CF04_9STRA|nr:Rieske [2Fe-2S] iron-sulfur domain-containing protein [Tribonema minus]
MLIRRSYLQSKLETELALALTDLGIKFTPYVRLPQRLRYAYDVGLDDLNALIEYHPAARLADISAVVSKARIADVDIALARVADGSVVAFLDACPHRGASFAKTRLLANDTAAQCPYHGFTYNLRDGLLQSGLGCSEGCGRLAMLPVFVDDGLVWHGYRTITGETRIACTAEQVLDNICDNIHLPMVHTFGNREDPVPHEYIALRSSPHDGVATFRYCTSSTSAFAFLSKSKYLAVLNEYRLPFTVGTTVTTEDGLVKVICAHARDVGPRECAVFWSLTRNFMTSPLLDPVVDGIMRMTLAEDAAILVKCDPRHARGKFHSRYDALQVMRRHAMRNLGR